MREWKNKGSKTDQEDRILDIQPQIPAEGGGMSLLLFFLHFTFNIYMYIRILVTAWVRLASQIFVGRHVSHLNFNCPSFLTPTWIVTKIGLKFYNI